MAGFIQKKKMEEKSGTPFCATNLDDAGLKFEVKCNKHFLGIKLHGCLERFPFHYKIMRAATRPKNFPEMWFPTDMAFFFFFLDE
jgi:hypothetical protein